MNPHVGTVSADTADAIRSAQTTRSGKQNKTD